MEAVVERRVGMPTSHVIAAAYENYHNTMPFFQLIPISPAPDTHPVICRTISFGWAAATGDHREVAKLSTDDLTLTTRSDFLDFSLCLTKFLTSTLLIRYTFTNPQPPQTQGLFKLCHLPKMSRVWNIYDHGVHLNELYSRGIVDGRILPLRHI